MSTDENTENSKVQDVHNENSIQFPGAERMLQISMDEYSKERERSNSLDSKTGVFISALNALVALYLPMFPFAKIKTVYTSGSRGDAVLTTIGLVILLIALVFLVRGFYYLIQSISLKQFQRVNYDNLNDREVLLQDVDAIDAGLVNHYHTILKGNVKINDEKAERLANGLKYSVYCFAIFSVATIFIQIVVS